MEELTERGIHAIYWPANSIDLNPIETIWNWIKEALHNRSPRISKLEDLRTAIKEAWKSIPQAKIDELMGEMQDRVKACIKAEGGHIPY